MNWIECFDPASNKYYYWEQTTNSTSWHIPTSQWRKFHDPGSGRPFFSLGDGAPVWDPPAGVVIPKPAAPRASAGPAVIQAASFSPASLSSTPSSSPSPLSSSLSGSSPLSSSPSKTGPGVRPALTISTSPASSPPPLSRPNSVAELSNPAFRNQQMASQPAPASPRSDRGLSGGAKDAAPASPTTLQRQVSQSVPSSPLEVEEKLEREGWLQKKSPSGLKGFRKWQKRWIVLTKKTLEYYKEPNGEKTGQIALIDIVSADPFPQKRMGCRFDIKVKSNRVYAFDSDTPQNAKSWVTTIRKAVTRAKNGLHEEKDGQKKGLATLSQLCSLFAKSWFGKGMQQAAYTPAEEQEIMKKMQDFTDIKVLHWICDNIMNPSKRLPTAPSKNIWDCDLRSDIATAEEYARREERLSRIYSVANLTRDEFMKKSKEEIMKIAAVYGMPLTDFFCEATECKGAPLDPHRICPGHINKIDKPNCSEQQVVMMLTSPAFQRVISSLFATPLDPKDEKQAAQREELHSIAFKVYWLLFRGLYDRYQAAEEFTEAARVFCSGDKYSSGIRKAYMTILLNEPAAICAINEEDQRVAFFNPVLNFNDWRGFFAALKNSPLLERKAALEDVNTVLHDNLENARTLQRIPNWQHLIFELLTDIPKGAADATVKTTFAFCINVLTMVHFEFYMRTDQFAPLLTETITSLYTFAGPAMEASQVGSILLSSLCSKLTAQKSMFSNSDFNSFEWQNLRELTKLSRKFCFATSYFNLHYKGEEEQDPAAGAAAPRQSQAIRAKALEEARRKESKFVLEKVYTKEQIRRSFGDEPAREDYGVHWNSDDHCGDISLCEKLAKLYQSLNMHVVDDNLRSQMQKEEKDYQKQASREYKFWQDARKFCDMVPRQRIVEGVLTERRLHHIAQQFLNAGFSSRSRQGVLSELSDVLSKGGGAPKSPSSSASSLVIPSETPGRPGSRRLASPSDPATPRVGPPSLTTPPSPAQGAFTFQAGGLGVPPRTPSNLSAMQVGAGPPSPQLTPLAMRSSVMPGTPGGIPAPQIMVGPPPPGLVPMPPGVSYPPPPPSPHPAR